MLDIPITQPLNSQVMITPFGQRLYSYGTNDSRVYLSKATNMLLNAFTYGYGKDFWPENWDQSQHQKMNYRYRTDCILDGLETEYKLTDNLLEVTVHPGNLIVDSTLLTFPNSTTVSLDLSNMDDSSNNGKIILSIAYKWIDTPVENPPFIRISHLNTDTGEVDPDGWLLDKDRLIITIFDFYKDVNNKVIPELLLNLVPTPKFNIKILPIAIKNYVYEISPMNKFIYNINKTIEHYYCKRLVYDVPPFINLNNLPNSKYKVTTILDSKTTKLVDISLQLDYDKDKVEFISMKLSDELFLLGKQLTINDHDLDGRLTIDITSPDNSLIDSGELIITEFKLLRSVPKDDIIITEAKSFVGTDNLGSNILLNDINNPISPTLEFINLNYTVIRETPPIINDSLLFIMDTFWTYDDNMDSQLVINNPEYIYYAKVDISDFPNKELMVQVYENNKLIIPLDVIITDNLYIYMPISFINQTEIPKIKVIIHG